MPKERDISVVDVKKIRDAEIKKKSQRVARDVFMLSYYLGGINLMDYQILVEADFLVNIFENGMEQEAARKVRDNIFKTKTGKKLLTDLYL